MKAGYLMDLEKDKTNLKVPLWDLMVLDDKRFCSKEIKMATVHI